MLWTGPVLPAVWHGPFPGPCPVSPLVPSPGYLMMSNHYQGHHRPPARAPLEGPAAVLVLSFLIILHLAVTRELAFKWVCSGRRLYRLAGYSALPPADLQCFRLWLGCPLPWKSPPGVGEIQRRPLHGRYVLAGSALFTECIHQHPLSLSIGFARGPVLPVVL